MSNNTYGVDSRQQRFTTTRRDAVRMRSDSSYFRVYHDFIRHLNLSIEEAAVLGDMINTSDMNRAEYRDGWFDYTVEWMYQRTHLDRNPQQRVINVLKEAGYIDVRKEGNPARRRVRINVELIENTISEGLEKASEPENVSTAQPENVSSSKRETVSSYKEDKLKLTPSGGCGGKKPDRNKSGTTPQPSNNGSLVPNDAGVGWCDEMADRLKHLVNKHGHTPSYSRKKWSRDFKSLRASLDGNETAIEAVLSWLEDNYETQHSPVISAEGFARRYNTLLSMSKYEHRRPPAPRRDEQVLIRLPDDFREDLEAIHWPNGPPDGLDRFAAETIDHARQLIGKCHEIKDAEDSDDYDEATAAEVATILLDCFSDKPERAANKWLRLIAADVEGWREWSGSFKGRELTPEGQFFAKVLKRLVKNYGGGTAPSMIASFYKALS